MQSEPRKANRGHAQASPGQSPDWDVLPSVTSPLGCFSGKTFFAGSIRSFARSLDLAVRRSSGWRLVRCFHRNSPLIRRNNNFYQNALERCEFTHPYALTWTQAEFRKRGYRVRTLEGDEVIYLYANKHSWATLSTFVFHAALVTLLMAGVISQWHGFPPNSPARRILPAPLVGLSDNLAGFTFDLDLAEPTDAHDLSEAHGIVGVGLVDPQR